MPYARASAQVACTITLAHRRIHTTPDTRKQLLKNIGLATLPLRLGAFVLLLTLLFDQSNENVNNYLIGVVLLQHATPPHLNTLNKNQPNPMAILMLLFSTALQRTVV